MANKSLFKSNRGVNIPAFNAINEAGGRAYSRTDEGLVAQYVVTGTFNGTFYTSAEEQLDTIVEKAKNCSTVFLAKAAVYARKVARMKDAPALLAAILTTRGEAGLSALTAVFNQVINNQKQLRNFVQIIRSGKVGRKSMGTAVKRLVQNWLAAQEADQLFYQSVGNDPSLTDIVKMVHPKPANKGQEAFYGWLLGRKFNKRYLPKLVKAFEAYKEDPTKNDVPSVDFRMLTALDLGKAQWTEIARNASWNTLRMNLNTFQRHGVLEDRELVNELAEKLRDKEAIRKNNAFPYQLLTTFKAVEGNVPVVLSNALQEAMELATQNVPVFDKPCAVCVDVSGSMDSPVTGYRTGSTTKTRCVDVAGLMAACVLRKNPEAVIVPFDTSVRMVRLNPLDSVMTNATKLAMNGGGTACHVALEYLLAHDHRLGSVIYVSDNQSWYHNAPSLGYSVYSYNSRSSTAMAWAKYKERNRKAKLVCIDIQPNSTVQVPDDKDVLNVGGFTDSVFEVVANFVNGDSSDFAKVIEDSVEL